MTHFAVTGAHLQLQVSKVVGLINIDGVEDTWSGERPAEPRQRRVFIVYGDVANASAALEASPPLAEGRTSANTQKNPDFRSIFERIAQQQDPQTQTGRTRAAPTAHSLCPTTNWPKKR